MGAEDDRLVLERPGALEVADHVLGRQLADADGRLRVGRPAGDDEAPRLEVLVDLGLDVGQRLAGGGQGLVDDGAVGVDAGERARLAAVGGVLERHERVVLAGHVAVVDEHDRGRSVLGRQLDLGRQRRVLADLVRGEQRVGLGPGPRRLPEDDHEFVLDVQALVVVVLVAGDAIPGEHEPAADRALAAQAGDGEPLLELRRRSSFPSGPARMSLCGPASRYVVLDAERLEVRTVRARPA